VVEHPLSKRKVGSSILPGGNFLAIVSRWCECCSCRWCARRVWRPLCTFILLSPTYTAPSSGSSPRRGHLASPLLVPGRPTRASVPTRGTSNGLTSLLVLTPRLFHSVRLVASGESVRRSRPYIVDAGWLTGGPLINGRQAHVANGSQAN
jgi:hypothetical protein